MFHNWSQQLILDNYESIVTWKVEGADNLVRIEALIITVNNENYTIINAKASC